MALDRIIANVYETRNYDMFKKLLGNRDVTEQRIAKITESIKNVGYVLNPCVINGKNEIIDGQGRVEALKRMNMPVHYVIDKNAGLEQCVQLNINGTPWKTMDYVKSYVHQGIHDYKNLLDLIETFPNINIDVIAYSVHGKTETRNGSSKDIRKHLGGRSTLITGNFTCTDNEMKEAFTKLEYAQAFVDIAKSVPGSSTHFLKAVIFAAFATKANKQRLYEKCYELQQDMMPFTNLRTALVTISKLYNKSCRKPIDFEAEYITFCAARDAAYKSRWAKEAV